MCSLEDSYDDGDDEIEIMCTPTGNQSETVKAVNISAELQSEQQLEVVELVDSFSDVLTDIPGRTEIDIKG